MIYEIKYPAQTTWWITYTDDSNTTVRTYGVTEPTQVTESPRPFQTFDNEAEWLAELAAHGITPEQDV